MANENENTPNNIGKKVAIGLSVDPSFYEILERFRSEEDRPMANMVERLLKTHPRIQPLLVSEPETIRKQIADRHGIPQSEPAPTTGAPVS